MYVLSPYYFLVFWYSGFHFLWLSRGYLDSLCLASVVLIRHNTRILLKAYSQLSKITFLNSGGRQGPSWTVVYT